MSALIAKTPQPPYYAVIFSNTLKVDDPEYHRMAAEMLALAEQQPGFLGFESARNEMGISVSYWQDMQAISAWRAHSQHKIAQQKGKSDWYKEYQVRIALVERAYTSAD